MIAALAASARHRPRLAASLTLAGAVALFYAPLLLGLFTFPDGDFTYHFLPFSLFQLEALRSLRLPLWNPHTFAGHPFLADTQAAVYYPVSNLLLLVTLPWQGAAARLYLLQGEAVLHTGLAGLFTYLLVRGFGASRWAALVAGITFALSGYLVAYPSLQLAVLRSAIWLPLILLLLWRAANGRAPWANAAGAGAAGACAFLAGHPQTVLHITYVSAGWAILLLVLEGRDGGARAALRYLAALALGTAVALLLSAAQLLPSLAFAALSVRANVDYAFVSGGFPLQDLWQIVLPGVFTYYSPLYVGTSALMLAVVAVAALPVWAGRRRREAAVVLFFAGTGLIALGLSLGGNGPLYPLAWRFLPGWDLFRGQERAAYVVALSLSVLAGLGTHALSMTTSRMRHRSGLIAAAVVLAFAYAFGLLWQLPGRTAVSNGRCLWIATVTMALAAATALVLWLPGWSVRRSTLLLALAALPLFLFGMGLNFEWVSPQARVAVAPEIAGLQEAVASAGDGSLPGRAYNEYRVYEDYAMRAGLEDLWGSSPLRLERYAAFAEGFPLDRWWALTGVGHVLTWRRDLFVPATLLAEFPQSADTTYLQRLDDPAPRAWLAARAQVAGDAEARALLADHEFDLRSTLLFSPESGLEPGALPPVAGDVRLTPLSPERLRVETRTDGDALLYVSQVWMPGWRVDGAPASGAEILGLPAFSVQRAHLAFMAVPLPAGSYTFDLVYDPSEVRRGLFISGATLLVLVAVVVAGLLRRRIRP